MFKPIYMNACLLLSLALVLSCSAVKNTDNFSTGKQLLDDVKQLSSDAYEGRKTGTKGAELAQNYISNRFRAIGLKSFNLRQDYSQDFSIQSKAGTIKGKNIVGFIAGKSDQAIVISAHYDHIGVIRNEIYNGADDNASGVAALLKFAAYFQQHQPQHTLIFVAFDAEEMGLQGAKAFVANPPLNLDKISMNINMDMISHNDQGELYACGTYKYPALKNYFYTTNPKLKVLFGHDNPELGKDDWTNQSDHAAFNDKNIPFLYFGVEDHKDYHKPTDEFHNINQTFFIDASNAILEIITNIDQEHDIQQLFHKEQRMKRQ